MEKSKVKVCEGKYLTLSKEIDLYGNVILIVTANDVYRDLHLDTDWAVTFLMEVGGDLFVEHNITLAYSLPQWTGQHRKLGFVFDPLNNPDEAYYTELNPLQFIDKLSTEEVRLDQCAWKHEYKPQFIVHIGKDGKLKNCASLTGHEIIYLVVEDSSDVDALAEAQKPGFGKLRYSTDNQLSNISQVLQFIKD